MKKILLTIASLLVLLPALSFARQTYKAHSTFINSTDHDIVIVMKKHKGITHPSRFNVYLPAHSSLKVDYGVQVYGSALDPSHKYMNLEIRLDSPEGERVLRLNQQMTAFFGEKIFFEIKADNPKWGIEATSDDFDATLEIRDNYV